EGLRVKRPIVVARMPIVGLCRARPKSSAKGITGTSRSPLACESGVARDPESRHQTGTEFSMHIKGSSYTIARWVLARAGRGVLSGLVFVAGMTGCANKQRLPEYDFRNRSIAIVTIAPPRPEILSGVDLSATL